MRRAKLMSVRPGMLAALAGIVQLSCQAILTAPAGSTMLLFVNPPFVEAHGGVSVVTAVVTESIGTPVADGTVVQFFTTLGRIEEQGRTNDGVARVNFVSDARSGTASISAVSGAAAPAEPATIEIGGARPVRVQVAAEPRRLTNSRTSQITATVLDQNGNPVPNIGVFFDVDGDATEFMESSGRIVFTDNDGRARDVLRTRYPFDAPAKVVTVSATPAATPGGGTDEPGSLSGEVDVFIN